MDHREGERLATNGRITFQGWQALCLLAVLHERRKKRERAEARAREATRPTPARNPLPRKTGVRQERK